MWIRKIVTGTAVVVFSGTAVAQGAFDFDNIPGVDQEPAIRVDLNPVVMSFLSNLIREADPEGAEMLGGLRSIKMRVYHNVDNQRQFNSFIANVTEELEDSGWMPVVSGQDEGSNVRIHMQMNEEEVTGMTFMVNDGSEAFFINIDGTVSAADLGRIMALPPVQQALGSMGLPGITPGVAPRPATD